jgi:hypothetical protein
MSTAQGNSRSFPLSISVSQRPIVPFIPRIHLDLVTSPNAVSEADVKLVNPTRQVYNIVGVSLAKDAPPNVHIEYDGLPVVCQSESHCVVAKVVVSGTRVGEVDANVIVTYQGRDRTADEQLQISVRGCVEYGSFEPSKSPIHLFPTDDSYHTIYFTNHFTVPVVVVGARIDSNFSKIVGFTPFIVPPGARSRELKIKYVVSTVDEPFEATLFVDTNATNHQIEVRGYNGKILVSQSPDVFGPEPETHFTISRAPWHSCREFTVYIRNPNPVPHVITDFRVTPGISVDAPWGLGRGQNYTLAPDAIERLVFSVTFLPLQNSRPRRDNITLGNSASQARVVIAWEPRAGSLAVSTTFPPVLTMGTAYNATVYVNSSYKMSLRLIGASADGFPVSALPGAIASNRLTPIATVMLLFTPAHFRGAAFAAGLEDAADVARQRQLRAPHAYTVPLRLQTKPGPVFRVSFDVAVAAAALGDVAVRVGAVTWHSTTFHDVALQNPHDCWVAFRGASFAAVAPPRGAAEVRVPVRVNATGTFQVSVPVATNLTAPFAIVVSGRAVRPRLAFADAAGAAVARITLGSSRPGAGVRFRNAGKAVVAIDGLACSGKAFSVVQDCQKTLPPNETCGINVSVRHRFVAKEVETGVVVVNAGQMTYELPIEFVLTPVELQRLLMFRKVRYSGVLALLCIVTIAPVARAICATGALWADSRRRVRKMLRQTECISQSCQVMFSEAQTGGVWGPTDKKTHVTAEALSEMAVLIANLM